MLRVASVFLFATALALAGEKPGEKNAPPAENAIAGAKRDFDAVRAARSAGPTEPGKADLPPLTTPPLQLELGPGLAPGSGKGSLRASDRKKSENWLVDAMMKKPEPTTREKNDSPHELMLDGATLGEQPAEARTNFETEPKNRTIPIEAKKFPGVELNPLARYMESWMTSQDYGLLRPALKGAVATEVATRGEPSLPSSAPNSAGALTGELGLGFSLLSKPAASTPAAARENPFLQSFAPPAAAPSTFTPPTSVASPPAGLAPLTGPAPAQSKLPEIAKPSRDDKYFKQLKRF
ncbi:MAG: hypothetical protein EXS32_13450 [Opitutus sp.]|nr:hypothetical protein [Opitutus sp.]